MASIEDLLEEIARIERDIEELHDYRAEVSPRNWTGSRWGRFKNSLKHILVARQIERHLRYLELQRAIAYNSYRDLEKTRDRGST